jgi:hypothetical protein
MTWDVTVCAYTAFHTHIAQLGHIIEVIYKLYVTRGCANWISLWWMSVVQKWATV